MKYAASIIVVLVLIKLYQIGSAPVQLQDQLNIVEQAEQTIDPITYIVTEESPREYFAVQLLDRLGNDQPSPEIISFVVEWTIAEDRSNEAIERNNPLNTTQNGNAENAIINSSGVRGYTTFEDGLNASVETIAYGDYDELLAGLQTNDPQRAFDGLINSPWAGDHYGDGERWPNVDVIEVSEQIQIETFIETNIPADGVVASSPIGMGSDPCGYNVAVALNANGGALQNITINPGETWSFNAAMGDPSLIPYIYCAGVPGGNWCNLAARYAQVARAFNANLDFIDHGQDLGAGRENSITIWNNGGQPGFDNGSQDLMITNILQKPLHLKTQIEGESVTIIGWQG